MWVSEKPSCLRNRTTECGFSRVRDVLVGGKRLEMEIACGSENAKVSMRKLEIEGFEVRDDTEEKK